MSQQRPYRIAVLTISDRASTGEAEDRSGPALEQLIAREALGTVVESAIIPDEIDAIRTFIERCTAGDRPVDLILTTGGTGLAPRDVTPEAVAPLFDKPAPNLMELARQRCLEKTPLTYLSRGVAGVVGRTLVLTLPGSPKGAVEHAEAILDILPHAIDTAIGVGERHHRPRA